MVSKRYLRTPVGYNGTAVPTRKLQDFLPQVLQNLQSRYKGNPQLVLDIWPKIIGENLAPMTRAVRFEEGVLYVHVKNSTLLQLLNTPVDKQKLVKNIRQNVPAINITNIVFRIG